MFADVGPASLRSERSATTETSRRVLQRFMKRGDQISNNILYIITPDLEPLRVCSRTYPDVFRLY